MSRIACNVISSSSAGNCTIINEFIVLDLGVSFKRIKPFYKDINLVFIGHEHKDHFNRTCVKILARERPTVRFAVGKWLVPMLLDCGVKDSNIDVIEIGKIYDYGEFRISPVKLYHDVEVFGLRIFVGEEKAFYATDTRTLEGITAKNYDLYLIECNYEDEEIQERIRAKAERGEFAYEKRVLHTHLSKAECDNFLVNNAGDKSEFVYMHEHEGLKNE